MFFCFNLFRLQGKSEVVKDELVKLGEQMVNSSEGTKALALELCREFEDRFLQHITGEVRPKGGSLVFINSVVNSNRGSTVRILYFIDNKAYGDCKKYSLGLRYFFYQWYNFLGITRNSFCENFVFQKK